MNALLLSSLKALLLSYCKLPVKFTVTVSFWKLLHVINYKSIYTYSACVYTKDGLFIEVAMFMFSRNTRKQFFHKKLKQMASCANVTGQP